MEKIALSGTLIMFLRACATAGPPQAPLETVPQIDLGRYTGTWFETASFPQRFQKGCPDARAEYRVVVNRHGATASLTDEERHHDTFMSRMDQYNRSKLFRRKEYLI